MTSQNSLAQADLDAVRELTHRLAAQRKLTREERSALWRTRRGPAVTSMLASPGLTYGQATGAPGHVSSSPDREEFQAALRAADHDLSAQIRLVSEGLAEYAASGEYPPPYHAWRVATLLRKARQYQDESDFCRAFTALFGDGPGARYRAIAERAKKARALAPKAGTRRRP